MRDGERIESVHTVSVSEQHKDTDNYTTASYKGLPPHPPPGLLPFCKDLQVEYLNKAIQPSLSVQDEVFEFPSVAAEHQDLDGRAITLVTGSSRKISVRLQRVTTSQATQTEPLWHEPGWNDSGSHTFPKMKSKFHGKAGKNKGFAKWENEKPSMQADVELEAEAPQDIQDHNRIETLPERQESEVSSRRSQDSLKSAPV